MLFELGRPSGSAAVYEFWSLREDVHVEPLENGALTLHHRWGDLALPDAGETVLDALRRMSLGPISLENVTTDPDDTAELHRLFDGIQHLVVRSLGFHPGMPQISLIPLTAGSRFQRSHLPQNLPVRMSRFATLRTDGSQYCLESPLSLHRVILHRPEAMWLISSLGRPVTPKSAAEALPRPGLPITGLLEYLAAVGMVVLADPTAPGHPPVFAEDTDPALISWSPADLTFHTHCTLGRHDRDFGATHPLGERWYSEPVVKPPMAKASIALARPHLEELLEKDPPLTAAIEGTVAGVAKPPTAQDLGELLYRTIRLRLLIDSPNPATPSAASSDRPYPSSANRYGLEFYAAVRDCSGISEGLYHYDPFGHRLEPLDVTAADLASLFDGAQRAAGLADPPPVLLTISSRFRRLSWKYNGLSYALGLKEVGSVIYLLRLVSRAMGLAGYPQDFVDIAALARILGTDWRTESCVGGFMLGHQPERGSDQASIRHDVNDAHWAERVLNS